MLIVLLCCLAAADAPKETELKKLAGHWHVTQQEHGGKKVPAKKLAALVVEVADERMTTREGDEVKEEARIVRLDSEAKPAAIDLKADKLVQGIWKLSGDTLTICVAEPGKDRPKEFAGKEGTGHTLLVLKKMKKKSG
jgi:uncharacterized protein (TIGR03067 family)